VSTAFHLTRLGVTDIVVVDERPPLTLTSDKSTECYRDWWPTTPMVEMMSDSISLLKRYADESNNQFALSQRGYLYVTGDRGELASMIRQATQIASLGAGDVRHHAEATGGYRYADVDGYSGSQSGADVFTTTDALLGAFGYITDKAVGGIHVRNAGWLSAQQLGAWMIDEASSSGVTFMRDSVTQVSYDETGIRSVSTGAGEEIDTSVFVNAAGPLIADVGRLVGEEIPVTSEIHQKVSFKDHREAFPREAPMVIWNDPQRIGWDDDVRAMLMESGRSDVVAELPPFVHGRPEGGTGSQWALGLWEWSTKTTDSPSWPLLEDDLYPELVMRGLATMLPSMSVYSDALPQDSIDGGYYTKTRENTPLVGPIGPDGSYICGALSGYGIMAACGVGNLAAKHIAGHDLPRYANAFRADRYDDPAYVASLAHIDTTGQI